MSLKRFGTASFPATGFITNSSLRSRRSTGIASQKSVTALYMAAEPSLKLSQRSASIEAGSSEPLRQDEVSRATTSAVSPEAAKPRCVMKRTFSASAPGIASIYTMGSSL